jgi:hypothetical protein
VKPDHNFGTCGGRAGAGDDTTKFFDPHNNFFYLTPDGNGPPLRLPTVRDGMAISPTCQLPGANCDGFAYSFLEEFPVNNERTIKTPYPRADLRLRAPGGDRNGLARRFDQYGLAVGRLAVHLLYGTGEYPRMAAPERLVAPTLEV